MNILNLAYFKQNQTGTEICAASIQTEFNDTFLENEQGNKMLKFLGTMKSSVEAQISKTVDCQPVIEAKIIPQLPTAKEIKFQSNRNPKYQKKENSAAAPTQKQLDYLTALVSKQNLSVNEFLNNNGFKSISDLDSTSCGSLINKLLNP